MNTRVSLFIGMVALAALSLTTAVLVQAKPVADKSDQVAIKQATAKYHNLDAALADGYEILFDCTVNPNNPGEAMGQHYINFGLKDDIVELDKPEVLMYEPQANGTMKLVGAEYVIFAEDWTKSEPPEFLGQEMHYKTSVGVHPAGPFYEVHAWVWKDNPNGVFADWNPDVSCRYE